MLSGAKLNAYWRLMRADRPIGWLLLLWPTLWALWIASRGMPSLWVLFVFVAGVWLTRAAGCIINDYADRWLDPHVERTKGRPLATGEVSGREALGLFALLMLVAFGLVLTMNRLTIMLSFVALALAVAYPYMKRVMPLPQVVLGMAFGFSIPMAFAAVLGEVPLVGWVLFGVNIVWSTAYDTWYGMVDIEDDLRMGSKSTAILFGSRLWLAQRVLFGVFLALLAWVGVLASLGWPFYVGLLVVAALIVGNFRVARSGDYFRAFLDNNTVGLVVFASVVAGLANFGVSQL